MSRLKRNHVALNDSSVLPMGILIRDYDKKIVDKDKIEDISYGPSIFREWEFSKDIDNPEWGLRSNFTKKI